VIDDNLKKSVQTKFFLGQGRDEEGQLLTKQSVTSLSVGLTAIQNAFNQVKAYTGNIGKIQKAVVAARVEGKKEASLEQSNVAPIQAPQGEITSLFPQLTKSLEELQKSLEKLELGQTDTGPTQAQKGGGSGGMGLLGTLAMGAGVAGIGYMALSGDEAQAATPPPEPTPLPPEPTEPTPLPPETPKASEVAKEAEQKASQQKADNQQSDSRRVQKQVSQDQRTEKLTKSVEQTAGKPVGVTKAAAPQAANDWSSKLSDFIGKSVKTSQARSAVAAGGGGMMASGDESGGGSDLTNGPYDLKLAKLLQNYEGAKTQAYKDSRGIPTIGIGATYYPPGFRLQGKVQMGQSITEEEAQQIKAAHVEEHRGRLLREVSSGEYSAMPEGVKAALESKVFNYGSLGGTLTQLTKQAVKTKNYKPVSNFFRTTLASHNGGLNSWRRNDEAALIDTGRSPRAKITFGGGGGGGAEGGYSTKAAGPVQRSGEAVQGMGFETAAAATRQAGVRGTNGNLDSSQLESIGIGSFVAQPSAAKAFKAMRAAAAKEGINLNVVSAYRSYQRQVELKKQKGKMAATPGRSNHGWGLAFDIPGLQKGNKPYKWLKANAERFGIYGPLAKPYEIWHWEYRGGGSLRPATVPVTSPAQQQQAVAPQLRSPAGATINDAAVTNPGTECKCDEPTVVAIPVGGGAPSPIDYLKGTKPAQASRKYNVNTADDYKIYFNAA
jgi:GH24 family phage-related lysozyme (muramidase)